MKIKIILPFEILLEKSDITRLNVETTEGSIGFLPNRLDCIAFLVPGIIVYQAIGEKERYVATHQGILVKEGSLISISVRNGIMGDDLVRLQDIANKEFAKRESEEEGFTSTLRKLESIFLHRVIEEAHRG